MSQALRVGVLGAGPAGVAHARGFAAAGGYRIESVCDLIPARVSGFRKEFATAREAESAEAMLKDPGLDVISICLPTDLHGLYAVKALRAKKHVVVESPAAPDVKALRAMARAAEKTGKVLLPAFPRAFGTHEAAARQAVDKGFLGTPYHVRATWHRPAGVPQGARAQHEPTGWYTDPARSGGGAFLDLGLPMLQLGWSLLGNPKPLSVMATTHSELAKLAVEEAGMALIRFEGNRSMELSAAWTIHAPPSTFGLTCRVHGTAAALDVYTPDGATLYRPATAPSKTGKPEFKPTLLKGPKVTHYPALFRHLKHLASLPPDAATLLPVQQALTLTRITDAIYKSSKTGKSVEIKD